MLMGPAKRCILLGVIVALISQIYSVEQVFSSEEETYFIATAYYSPLPGQSRYTTGSYAGDIRLNGSGIITASGKGVFPGLLAGPKNYPFGTKIYFEGYGIGEIADRGGAIVKAGERGHSYDRIDIWMGHGDEGLARALKWGTRTIKGKIIVPSAEVSLALGESPLGYFEDLRVHPKSGVTEVKRLQEIFTKAQLYNGEIDGEYQSIRNELIDFQIKNSIISGYADEEAGYFGPKTVASLRKKYSTKIEMLVEEPIAYFANYDHTYASEIYKKILAYGDLQVDPDASSEDVKALQKLLHELGEYSESIDGKYSSVEPALIDLQKKIGLIKNSDDWGAGYFGNKTKSALWVYYESISDSSLSTDEKNRISNALNLIRKRLKTQELRGGEKMDIRLKNLKKQISDTLPNIEDPLLKSKLQYLETQL